MLLYYLTEAFFLVKGRVFKYFPRASRSVLIFNSNILLHVIRNSYVKFKSLVVFKFKFQKMYILINANYIKYTILNAFNSTDISYNYIFLILLVINAQLYLLKL